MELETRDFGKLEVEKEDMITFPDGLPGFLDEKQFVLLPLDEKSPFIIMQSTNEADLAFITLEAGKVVKDYEFEINEKAEKLLKLDKETELLVLTIATMQDDIQDMTINLAAPVVINLEDKLAKQVIVGDDNFPVKHKVFAEKKVAP